MKLVLLIVCVSIYIAGTGMAALQTTARPTARYDTAAQTEKKEKDFTMWAYTNQHDADHPIYDTKEYMDRVIAILKTRRPRPTGYEDFESVETKDADITGKGEWLADVIHKLGLNFKEVSRTSIGGVETTMFQWANPDGSNALCTFQDRRIVSKAQSGLK